VRRRDRPRHLHADKLHGATPGVKQPIWAHQVRARHQPQDRQGDRVDGPAVAAAARGSAHRI